MTRARIGLVALLLSVLAGCTTAATGGPASDGGGQVSAGSAPPTPASAPTGSGSGGPVSRPSISLPTLPGGNGGDSDGDQPATHCVAILYLASVDIPEGVTLTVAKVEINSGGQFFALAGACPGNDSCDGFTWTSANQSDNCWVLLSEIGTWTGERTVGLTLRGAPTCDPSREAVCVDYARQIKDQNTTIPVTLRRRETTTEVPPTDTVSGATSTASDEAPQTATTN